MKKVLLAGIPAVLCGWLIYVTARAAITLLYFIALVGANKITLQWATGSELNNAGFYIQKSSQQNDNFTRLNPTLIPAVGDISGAEYLYEDTQVLAGKTYWYRLEIINTNGQSEFNDPIQAAPGTTPTATPTATPSKTPTPLITQTATVTGTPMQTPAISSTATPRITHSLTPSSSPVASVFSTRGAAIFPSATQPVVVESPASSLPLGSSTPAPTFKPYPTVSWVFPQTDTPEQLFSIQWSPEQPGMTKSTLSIRINRLLRYWPVFLLAAIWLAISIWFIKSQRPQ